MRLGLHAESARDTILQISRVRGRCGSEDITWYGPNNFATIAATNDLGLGEGEWLFGRWTDGGVWQGGPRLVRNGMKRLLPSHTPPTVVCG